MGSTTSRADTARMLQRPSPLAGSANRWLKALQARGHQLAAGPLALLGALALSACSSVDFNRPASEFGAKPSVQELHAEVDAQMEDILYFPETKRIRWKDAEPVRAALWRGTFSGGWTNGWALRFRLNAQNHGGLYVGEQPGFVIRVAGETILGEQGDDFRVVSPPGGGDEGLRCASASQPGGPLPEVLMPKPLNPALNHHPSTPPRTLPPAQHTPEDAPSTGADSPK